ncbi:hypothetical protein NPIL_415441 [Nephila pilipes]|uniref:Uncharacterized protein n=1 Tax=Nephila pilipes TaxID=299642 RepID=A0A8X6I9V8_NEPPI|nr:hypothetical protein NPIL_415441 [Nephila pilipes]
MKYVEEIAEKLGQRPRQETQDPAVIAVHLTVLETLQKFDDRKSERFESAAEEEIYEIEVSFAEKNSDVQNLKVDMGILPITVHQKQDIRKVKVVDVQPLVLYGESLSAKKSEDSFRKLQ